MSPTNTFFSVMSALSLPLVCMPLPWHLEAWNTGTCLFMMWTAVGLLVSCIDSIVWRHDALVRATVWCDITTKLTIGWSVGLPAASLCINRRLYIISSIRSLTMTKAEKVRAVLIDLAICLLLPLLVMALHFIVQGHRFNIYEELGCLPTSSSTWVTFVIVFLPPFVLLLISSTYSVRSLLQLRKCQKELSEVLSSSSTLTTSRFFRLMALASVEILIDLPFQLALIILNKDNFHRWISWEETHFNFGRIPQVPSAFWKANPAARHSMEFARWMLVVCALIFFLFFGFAEEARKHYKGAVDSISKRVGISPSNTFTPGHKFGSITSSVGQFKVSSMHKAGKGLNGPVLISKEVFEKRDSSISFTSIGDTEIGTLRTTSRSITPSKNSVVDVPKTPTSPSFRFSVPSAAGPESFLEFSCSNREIAPITAPSHRI